jgi:hypothetical protein
MLSDENLDIIEGFYDKINQKGEVINIGKDNILDRKKFKFEQSRYATPEEDRSKRFYFFRDIKYVEDEIFISLFAESRPLNLVFIINASESISLSRQVLDSIFASATQFLLDLSLKDKLDRALFRRLRDGASLSLGDNAGRFYFRSYNDLGVVEEVVKKSELL